ncbi:MAG TPA: HD domain-containing protein [Sediminispirochaeta sp.]|nr:HD domain-containing protein [Sediminispirochaeta sp.]
MLSRGEMYDIVRSWISLPRLLHSLRTAECSAHLAVRFQLSVERAYLAGLAHDIAREVPESTLIGKASDDEYELLPEDRRYPILLHGRAAAEILRIEYGEKREDLLQAIRWHTQGSPEMGSLGKALFIADYIEEGRRHITDEERRRILNTGSLEAMCFEVVERHRAYLELKGLPTSRRTEALIERLTEEKNENGKAG